MSIIAICSDSHDNLTNITKFLFFCNNNDVETILHCGDWCAPSVLRFFRENFKGKIYGVYGNVHADDKTMKKFATENNITIKEDKLAVKIEKIKVLLTHYPEIAQKMAKTGKYQIVFYGHNHKPWMEKIGKTFTVNPGTLAGMFAKATFAIYNTKTKKLDLKILENI